MSPGALGARSDHSDTEVNWVSDADIKGCFDNVCHERLVELLQIRISDPKLLALIQRFLIAGVMIEGKLETTEDGVPQGASLAPQTILPKAG